VSVWPKTGSGPMWWAVTDEQQQACQRYWFTNLLYFNNLYSYPTSTQVSILLCPSGGCTSNSVYYSEWVESEIIHYTLTLWNTGTVL